MSWWHHAGTGASLALGLLDCGPREERAADAPAPSTRSAMAAPSASSSAPGGSDAAAVAPGGSAPEGSGEAFSGSAPPAVASAVASASASAASSAGASSPPEPRLSSGCYEQAAQPMLIRGTYYPAREHREAHAASVRYRAEKYGTIPRLTPPELNTHSAQADTLNTTFFGLAVQLHRRVIPALQCVERELRRVCKAPYRPQVLAGFRPKNTYHQGEITNHLFGLAIDIDPHRNPCCHCIEPWSNHPRCGNRKATPFQHMEMPACWVETFERFGFYWLGHDRLEDTMHFEFLGDPDRIVPPRARKK